MTVPEAMSVRGGPTSHVGVFDFFCGCGGASAGLRSAGMRILGGLDSGGDAGRTFRRNFPEASFFERDIRGVDPSGLDAPLSAPRPGILVFAACAPCQPFSKQNRQKTAGDHRRSLLDELRPFVARFRPDCLFVENVPGIRGDPGADGPLPSFLDHLAANGYRFSVGVVQSSSFGVPQLRQRLLLVASRHGQIGLPCPTHGPGATELAPTTVWDAIGRYPALDAGGSDPAVPNHCSSRLSDANLARIRATPEGGGRSDWPGSLLAECHRGHSGHSDVYGRLWKGRSAPAMTTRCISLSNGRFGHPVQDRALSVREAAALQTFDDSFVFCGGINSMAKQIGNAVPPRLAQAVGMEIIGHMSRIPTGA